MLWMTATSQRRGEWQVWGQGEQKMDHGGNKGVK